MGIDTPDTMMKQYELRLINEMYESVTIPLFATAFSSHLLVVPHISPIRTTTWSDSLTKANLRGHLYLRPKFGVTRFEPVSHEPASCTVPQHQRRTLSLLAHVLHSPTHSLTSFLASFHLASQHPRIAHTTQCLLISGNCPSATYLHTTALQQAPKRCSTALRALPSNGLWCIWLVRRGRE